MVLCTSPKTKHGCTSSMVCLMLELIMLLEEYGVMAGTTDNAMLSNTTPLTQNQTSSASNHCEYQRYMISFAKRIGLCDNRLLFFIYMDVGNG